MVSHDDAPGGGTPPAAESGGSGDDRSPLALLVIEEDPADVLQLSYDLDTVNGVTFEVTHAACIEDGLRLIEEGRFDAMLLDLTLPEGYGSGVLARARSAFASVPVIVMAHDDDPELALEAVRLGAQGYLVKRRYEVAHLVQTILHAVARYTKLSELQMAKQRDHFRATHDELTGLYNRSALHDFMERCLAQAKRNGTQVAVLFLDLDRFKVINDTAGHDVGDELLRMVAERLKAVTRRSNMAARLGGDEFILLLQDLHEDHMPARVAEIVVGMLSKPFVIDGTEHGVGTSIGIAVYPTDSVNHADLIRKADTAMYHAKAKGRNRYHFYAEGMDAVAARRLEAERALRNARSCGELLLHYQPILDVVANRVTGVVALLRWQRGDELLNAADFLPVAERIGVLDDIGAWALHQACEAAASWNVPEDGDFRVIVKVSPGQIEDRKFVDTVARTLRATGVNAQTLGIEVRHGCSMRENKTSVAVLRGLRDLGITVTIEDFGSGCSSLTALKEQPMDAVKIGRDLVEGAIEDEYDRSVVAMASLLAQSLGIDVIATGVETESERDLLVGLGCTRMLGNLFAPPVEADAVSPLLERLGLLVAHVEA